jgi:rsbT antagonist protein RsbS
MGVPILKQAQYLIATIQSALSDRELLALQASLLQEVGKLRSRGVIVDGAALDVLDSFALRTLRDTAHMIRLRGAETVIVGLQPQVASAMLQLGATFESVATALDLQEGLAYLEKKQKPEADELSCIPVASVNDVVTARLQGRTLAERLGFTAGDATLVATAISELARNIVQHAGDGEIVLRSTSDGARRGIVVVARDHGPGIADPTLAASSRDSISGRLGKGLPGVRRIVDDFRIVSDRKIGTTIAVTKWKI